MDLSELLAIIEQHGFKIKRITDNVYDKDNGYNLAAIYLVGHDIVIHYYYATLCVEVLLGEDMYCAALVDSIIEKIGDYFKVCVSYTKKLTFNQQKVVEKSATSRFLN